MLRFISREQLATREQPLEIKLNETFLYFQTNGRALEKNNFITPSLEFYLYITYQELKAFSPLLFSIGVYHWIWIRVSMVSFDRGVHEMLI